MVSANRGSDHSAGPEALDPNHCRQPTPCLDVLTVHSNELCLFWGQGIFPTQTIIVVVTTLNSEVMPQKMVNLLLGMMK